MVGAGGPQRPSRLAKALGGGSLAILVPLGRGRRRACGRAHKLSARAGAPGVRRCCSPQTLYPHFPTLHRTHTPSLSRAGRGEKCLSKGKGRVSPMMPRTENKQKQRNSADERPRANFAQRTNVRSVPSPVADCRSEIPSLRTNHRPNLSISIAFSEKDDLPIGLITNFNRVN